MAHNLLSHVLRLDITSIATCLLLYVTSRWKLWNVNVGGISGFLLRGERDGYRWTAWWHAGQAGRHPTGQQHAQTCRSHKSRKRAGSSSALKLQVRRVKPVTSLLLHLRFFPVKTNIFPNVTAIGFMWMANSCTLLLRWWFLNWAVGPFIYIYLNA